MNPTANQQRSGELRFTETNSGDDSKGRTWGLDGGLFWYLLGGLFVFVMLLLVCFSMARMSFPASLGIAAMPLALVLAYVFGLRQGKPPAYDRDLCDYALRGRGFSPLPLKQPRNPLK